MSKSDTDILYAPNNVFQCHKSSIFSLSRIQSPNTFLKFPLSQCMEETGHVMGWVPWCKAAALAFLSAEAFRHVMGWPAMSVSFSSQPNTPRFGHREPLSIPPSPPRDLLSLGELSTRDVGKQHVLWPPVMRILSSWVQMGGRRRGKQEKQVFTFREAHC